MLLFRQLAIDKPQHPSAGSMTLERLRCALATSRADSVCGPAPARCWHDAGQLFTSRQSQRNCGRHASLGSTASAFPESQLTLVSRLSLCHLETGQEAPQPDAELHKRAVQELGLSLAAAAAHLCRARRHQEVAGPNPAGAAAAAATGQLQCCGGRREQHQQQHSCAQRQRRQLQQPRHC